MATSLRDSVSVGMGGRPRKGKRYWWVGVTVRSAGGSGVSTGSGSLSSLSRVPQPEAVAPFTHSCYHRIMLLACGRINFLLFVAPLRCSR